MLLKLSGGIQISEQIPSLKQIRRGKTGKLQKGLKAAQDLGGERQERI